MKSSSILISMPMGYYYLSRYNTLTERLAHVIKFWGVYLLAAIMTDMAGVETLPMLVIGWLLFANFYDYFVWRNDSISVKQERFPSNRNVTNMPLGKEFIFIKSLTSGLLLIALFLLAWPSSTYHFHILLIMLSGVFITHNRLPEKFRWITYFALYLLKGLLFPAITYNSSQTGDFLYYGIFTFLFSLSYLPKYYLVKSGRLDNNRIITKRHYFLLQPVFLKNIFLAILSLFHFKFAIVLGFIDVATLLEALILGHDVRKKSK